MIKISADVVVESATASVLKQEQASYTKGLQRSPVAVYNDATSPDLRQATQAQLNCEAKVANSGFPFDEVFYERYLAKTYEYNFLMIKCFVLIFLCSQGACPDRTRRRSCVRIASLRSQSNDSIPDRDSDYSSQVLSAQVIDLEQQIM